MTLRRLERLGKMRNINKDGRKTIFMDIDGTLVPHNYDPEHIPDTLIKKSVDYLKKEMLGSVIFLVTSRSYEHAHPVEALLRYEGVYIQGIISGLPTGQRILVNDYKNISDEPKAIALNVPEGVGVDDTGNCEFHKQWCS